VILNYNGWEDTLACLDSIALCQDKPHIVVVDNASTDESVVKLRSAYPDVDLLIAPVNAGFAAGNNLGIRRALRLGVKVIHILNNDTIVDPSLFARAYRAAVGQNKIIGAKIYYARGYEYHMKDKNRGNVLWYAGGDFDAQNGIGVHRGIDEIDRGQYDHAEAVPFMTGCYLAIPRGVVQKLGFFDERFFLYLEDLEYSLRARQKGIILWYQPSLVLYHKNGGSATAGSPFVDYYMTRNRFLLAEMYGSFRFRLALFREALTRNWGSHIRRRALFDYVMRRFGARSLPLSGQESYV
jgi:hypothetical protein